VNYRTDLHEPQVGHQQFDQLQVLTVQIVLFSVLQLLLAMAASLGYMITGLVRGFSSPGVPSMQQISPHLVPDDNAVSWICKYVIFTSYKFKPSRYEKECLLIVCLNIQHKHWVLKFHASVEFWFIYICCFLFIHLLVCLMTGSKFLPKRALHIVRSRASSFK